jgi:6-phosphogluconate dehydrogenase
MGYCLMIGGPEDVFRRLEPILRTLAPEEGYAYMGPSGAGHFVKMVHNGIEYGLLQAYAEGFELLHASAYELDLAQLARLWNRGSVVRSWLLELTEKALAADPDLASVRGYVEDSGEGRWTVLEAVERGVPLPVISLSLLTRFRSQQDESFSAKVIAALRREFGGHAVKSD